MDSLYNLLNVILGFFLIWEGGIETEGTLNKKILHKLRMFDLNVFAEQTLVVNF